MHEVLDPLVLDEHLGFFVFSSDLLNRLYLFSHMLLAVQFFLQRIDLLDVVVDLPLIAFQFFVESAHLILQLSYLLRMRNLHIRSPLPFRGIVTAVALLPADGRSVLGNLNCDLSCQWFPSSYAPPIAVSNFLLWTRLVWPVFYGGIAERIFVSLHYGGTNGISSVYLAFGRCIVLVNQRVIQNFFLLLLTVAYLLGFGDGESADVDVRIFPCDLVQFWRNGLVYFLQVVHAVSQLWYFALLGIDDLQHLLLVYGAVLQDCLYLMVGVLFWVLLLFLAPLFGLLLHLLLQALLLLFRLLELFIIFFQQFS